MTKAALIQELQDNLYVMIKASGIHGIGVFAINFIPKGCREMFSKTDDGWVKLSFEEVAALPMHTQYLIENFCLYDTTHFFVPANGFKKMDISLYLNHSDNPNIISLNEGEEFEANRDILPGEELLIDYGTIVDWE
ncbi:MAG: SET domain-containing protein [Saprospiraceae bacterium]